MALQIVKLVGVDTLTAKGEKGDDGPIGLQGVAGPGAGAFEVDYVGDLMPAVNIIAETFYDYDINGDIQPAV